MRQFLQETAALGEKRGPILVQLPPSLQFDRRVAGRFFDMLREEYDGPVVCEPRHVTWFAPDAGALLERFAVSRVAADPPPAPGSERPGGSDRLVYFRLHGSPHKYWSKYEDAFLESIAATIGALPASVDVWCVFDNTASGAALENAWEFKALLKPNMRAWP